MAKWKKKNPKKWLKVHLRIVSISRFVFSVLSFYLFICNSHLFSCYTYQKKKKKHIFTDCSTAIYTYLLCIYEDIPILSTLVYVCNAKKKKQNKKDKKLKVIFGWPVSYLHIFSWPKLVLLVTLLNFSSFCILHSLMLRINFHTAVSVLTDYGSVVTWLKNYMEQCLEVDTLSSNLYIERED